MLSGLDFIFIISYVLVKKWSMFFGWEIIGNEGFDLRSYMYELLEN